ncbi:MAG: hypothetical protein ACUVRV_07115 [Cyanobacteriota bacterium]
MLRCPACHWINLDSNHHCRRCGHFLRRYPRVSKGSQIRSNRLLGKQKRRKARWQIRWDWVLTLTAILGGGFGTAVLVLARANVKGSAPTELWF